MPELTRTVGRFEIVRRIARGGMGVVYLARQRGLDRDVALKELVTFAEEADTELAQRFLREARLAGALNHPNIVTVFDYFEHDGTPYIAMEFMEGGSLRQFIGHLTVPQIASVLESLLAGLAYAEKRGIVHRDLKPENLLVSSDATVKIADLGIAKAYNEVSLGLTSTGMALGTPTYMAPEQAIGRDVSPQTDLYATGVIAYELFTGRVPFPLGDAPPLAVLWRHVNVPVPPPLSLKPDLDPRFAAWLEALLAKDPADRPAGARAAWHALEEIIVDLFGWRWRQRGRLIDDVEAVAEREAPKQMTTTRARPTLRGAQSTRDASWPEPEPAPWVGERPTPPRRSRSASRRVRAAALGTALALMIGMGFGLGRSRASLEETASEPALASVVGTGLRLRAPSSWQRAARPIAVPGVTFTDRLALAPSEDGGPQGLVVGRVAAAAPSFLPQSLTTRIEPEALRHRQRVRLGGAEAFRYPALRPRGSGLVYTLYVVPLSKRSTTMVACAARTPKGLVLRVCDRIAATLRLPGVRTFAVVPSTTFTAVLGGAIRRLETDRRSAAASLRAAKTQRRQSEVAMKLASLHSAAAQRVRRAPKSPLTQAHTESLATTLEASARAYRQLATAAREGKRDRYSAALRLARKTEAELQSRLVEFRQIGLALA